jgi:hypothetical protein
MMLTRKNRRNLARTALIWILALFVMYVPVEFFIVLMGMVLVVGLVVLILWLSDVAFPD